MARQSAARDAPAQDERTLEEALRERAEGLSAWLREHAPYCSEEQTHLDAESRERAYWHYGYAVALRDVLELLGSGQHKH